MLFGLVAAQCHRVLRFARIILAVGVPLTAKPHEIRLFLLDQLQPHECAEDSQDFGESHHADELIVVLNQNGVAAGFGEQARVSARRDVGAAVMTRLRATLVTGSAKADSEPVQAVP